MGALFSAFAVLLIAILFQNNLTPSDSEVVPRRFREALRHTDACFKPAAGLLVLCGAYLCGHDLMYSVRGTEDIHAASAVAIVLFFVLFAGAWLRRFFNSAWLAPAEPHLAPIWNDDQPVFELTYSVVAMTLVGVVFAAVISSLWLVPVVVIIVLAFVVQACFQWVSKISSTAGRKAAVQRTAVRTDRGWRRVGCVTEVSDLRIPFHLYYHRASSTWAMTGDDMSLLRRNLSATIEFLKGHMTGDIPVVKPKLALRWRPYITFRLESDNHTLDQSCRAHLVRLGKPKYAAGLYMLGELGDPRAPISWWAAHDEYLLDALTPYSQVKHLSRASEQLLAGLW